jgi:hypothetical protein
MFRQNTLLQHRAACLAYNHYKSVMRNLIRNNNAYIFSTLGAHSAHKVLHECSAACWGARDTSAENCPRSIIIILHCIAMLALAGPD